MEDLNWSWRNKLNYFYIKNISYKKLWIKNATKRVNTRAFFARH